MMVASSIKFDLGSKSQRGEKEPSVYVSQSSFRMAVLEKIRISTLLAIPFFKVYYRKS